MDGVILDVAHNADGARALARALCDDYPEQPVDLVFGVMADKDYAEILFVLSGVTRRVHLCPAVSPRSHDATRFTPLAVELGLPVSTCSTCANALAAAGEAAGMVGRVCATGSFAVVAELRRILLGDQVLADGEERWT